MVTQPIIVPDKKARVEGQHPIAAAGQSFDIHEHQAIMRLFASEVVE